MRAPRTALPATLLPRASRLDAYEASRPIWLWRGTGPALTPRGLVPLEIEGAAPAVMTPSGPGLRIERGTTNFVTNPSFEVDLTGWSAVAGATISRETAGGGAVGNAYARVAVSSTGHGIRFAGAGNATQGQAYAASMYLRAATPADVGKKVQVYLDAPGGTYEIVATDHVLTATWARAVLPATWARAGHTGWGVVARSAIAQGSFAFLLDAAQYEHGADSTYADGTLGVGFTWTAGAHGSSSVRARAILRSRIPPRIKGVGATVAPFWPAADGETHTVLEIRGTGGQFIGVSAESTGVWRMTFGTTGRFEIVELMQAHDRGEVVALTARWVPGLVEMRVGTGVARAPLTVLPTATELTLGSSEDADDYLAGVLTRASAFGT